MTNNGFSDFFHVVFQFVHVLCDGRFHVVGFDFVFIKSIFQGVLIIGGFALGI